MFPSAGKIFRSPKVALSLFTVALGTLSSCNFYEKKGVAEGSTFPAGQTPWFAVIRQQVFEPNCLGCHSAAGGNSGGVNLETYSAAKSFASDIKKEVAIERSMPPRGPLGEDLRDLVSRWVDAGAPETEADAQAPAFPEPTPTPTVFLGSQEVDYDLVKSQLIDANCIKCHGAGSRLIHLDTYEHLKAAIDQVRNEVIVEKSMPPSGAVSTTLQDLLQKWIDGGLLPGTAAAGPLPIASPSPSASPSSSAINFATVSAQLFTPSCVRCHGSAGGVSLDNYASVKANIDRIRNEVIVEKSMPPRGPVSTQLQTLLQSWIDGGLNEN